MSKIFELYGLNMGAGVVASIVLAVLGAHLATREKSLQTLCSSQAAMLGVLLGLGYFGEIETHTILHLGPYASAVLCATAIFVLGEFITHRKPASKSSVFLALFAVLMACSYLVTALVPALETHLAQAYFGDLATLCEVDAIATSIICVFSLLFLVWKNQTFSRQSFFLTTFGSDYTFRNSKADVILFNLIVVVVLCLCIQFLGFLFSLCMLFLPTVILCHTSQRRLFSHFLSCAVLAGVSTSVGFGVSLSHTRIPTVPTITLTLTLLGGVLILSDKLLLLTGLRKTGTRIE